VQKEDADIEGIYITPRKSFLPPETSPPIPIFSHNCKKPIMFPIRHSRHRLDFVSGHSREHLEKTLGPYTHAGPTEVRSHYGGGFTVGDAGLMVRSKCLEPDYDDSEAHIECHKLYGIERHNPPELQVPTDHMSIHVTNALESLTGADLTSLLANEECGKEAFVKQLIDSQAAWANDLISCTPRTDPRTERSENVAVHTASRSFPLPRSTLQPTLFDYGPPIVSITTEGGPGTGHPISIAPISVQIPYVGSQLTVFAPRYTLKQDTVERFVSNLRVLEPSIGQVLKTLLGDYHEKKRADAETKIASLLEPEVKIFFEYGVGEKDLERNSPDDRSMTVGSSWEVQDISGRPRLHATMRGEERTLTDQERAASVARDLETLELLLLLRRMRGIRG